MFFRLPSRNRPYHLGSYPLETLPHDHAITAREQERPAVGDVIAFADVFEHPHRNHAVVAPGVFAVIHLMDVYAGFESARPDSGAGRLHLLVREREPGDTNVECLTKRNREAAPAAADIEHVLAVLEAQLGRNQVAFCALRLFQGGLGMIKVGAGIVQVVVEACSKQHFVQIIVMTDVAVTRADAVP